MGLDYYAILDVPRDSTSTEIILAYRKWAIRTHPIRFKLTPDDSIELPFPVIDGKTYWCYLNEAYDVLSNPLRRQIFDLYGEEGLKRGVQSPSGYIDGYSYHGECEKTYASFLGSYSPFADLIDAVTQPAPLFSTCGSNKVVKVKGNAIERLLYLDLTEVFFGGIKKIKILRNELVGDMQCKTEVREKLLLITILPGVVPGTRFTFKEEGDQGPTKIPADIVFIVAEKQHEIFKRNNADLYMNYVVDLKRALIGFGFTINTVDGRKINIPITTTPIVPGYVKTVVGEGLPLLESPNCRGNLYISFEITFPNHIPKSAKLKFIEAFQEIEKNCLKNEKVNDIQDE